MNIHLYTSGSADQTSKLAECISCIKTIENNISIKNINIHSDLNEEINNLLIFMVTNINELDFLIEQKDKITNNRIIIILSENSMELINKAYLLNPRFIDFSDNGYRQIAEIIKKISSKNTRYSYPRNSSMSACYHPGGSL